MKFQHTIIQMYIFTYNGQWDLEAIFQTYVDLSPSNRIMLSSFNHNTSLLFEYS